MCSLYDGEHMFGRILLIAVVALVGWAVFARTSSGAEHPARYVVKPSDTLWSIVSSRYAGDPREAILRVREANHLRGATIVPGQKLRLP
jgi:nucleoid-associated protein YgaU